MYKIYLFTILTLLTYTLSANEFTKLNPPLTQKTKEIISHAEDCRFPAKAEEKFTKSFQYGCFCGKDYPHIKHPSLKEYKDLNKKEKEELINQYYAIKPYDSIDESCMKHDICFIYRGEEQECNDAIYHELKELREIFKAKEKKSNPTAKECRVLSADMASYFRTIFSIGENVSIIKYGVFAMMTPLTLGGKIIQKTPLMVEEKGNYPDEGVRCLVK